MRSLLIVEDSAVSRRVMERILRPFGWAVSSATTVAEALGMLSPPPDCILLDLMLPDGAGEEVLRKVRSEDLSTKVIVITGCSERQRLEEVEGLQPLALFRKPLDLSLILAKCQ